MDNKTILFTDINGFVSFHAKVFFTYFCKNKRNVLGYDLKNRQEFDFENIDTIYYSGFKNRGSDLIHENLESLNFFINQLNKRKVKVNNIVFLNSIKALEPSNSDFKKSKLLISARLSDFCKANHIYYFDLHLPNLFGEFAKINSNSFVATCANAIINNEEIDFLNSEAIDYFYVGDIVQLFSDLNSFHDNLKKLKFLKLSAKNIYQVMQCFNTSYKFNGEIPKLKNSLYIRLFNTYKSHYNPSNLIMTSKVHVDERGSLVENLNYDGKSSNFISTTHKNKIRGNHFHSLKIERFRFYSGNVNVVIRKLFDTRLYTYNFGSNLENFIDIPTYFTHCIVNNSEVPALGIFSSVPKFEKTMPDTYHEEVL